MNWKINIIYKGLSLKCFSLALLICFFSCELTKDFDVLNEKITEGTETKTQLSADSQAVVIDVKVTGNEANYTFSVQLKSPDLGCDQYADWWEVFSLDTTLIYRRILGHSHVNEQPFTRSGGPVKIQSNENIYIRGHMNNFGYGSLVFKGSVDNGFKQDTIEKSFGPDLSKLEPLPTNCAF